MIDQRPLWEKAKEHPYYCSEGNYYSNECHTEYNSLVNFLIEWGDIDLDYNHVWRWDWEILRATSDGELGPDEEAPPGVPVMEQHTLKLYIMGQRKARAASVYVRVKRDDEPVIRAWLAKHAAIVAKLWDGFI